MAMDFFFCYAKSTLIIGLFVLSADCYALHRRPVTAHAWRTVSPVTHDSFVCHSQSGGETCQLARSWHRYSSYTDKTQTLGLLLCVFTEIFFTVSVSKSFEYLSKSVSYKVTCNYNCTQVGSWRVLRCDMLCSIQNYF